MKYLVLVRHGETDFNKQRLLQGQTNTPLNDTGRAQAKRVAQVLRNDRFDAIWSSPLDRAIETATTINQFHQLPVQPNVNLLERSFGDFEGEPISQLREQEPADVQELFHFSLTNGESLAQIHQRATRILTLFARQAPDRLLVVGHAGIFRALIGALLNWQPEQWLAYPQDNTCMNSFRFDDDGQVVAYQLNDAVHNV